MNLKTLFWLAALLGCADLALARKADAQNIQLESASGNVTLSVPAKAKLDATLSSVLGKVAGGEKTRPGAKLKTTLASVSGDVTLK